MPQDDEPDNPAPRAGTTRSTPSRLRDLPAAEGARLNEHPRDGGIWNRPDRPFIVSIVGWVCAVVGYFSFFLKASQLPAYFFPELLKRTINPHFQPLPLSRGQFLAAVSILLAEVLLGLLAMIGGIGSLKMREWGRRAAIYYGIVAIALSLLRGLFQLWTFDMQIDYRISTTTEAVDRDALANREFFYFVTSTLAFMVWPLLVIAVMTRGYVRAAFARANPKATASGDDEWRSS